MQNMMSFLICRLIFEQLFEDFGEPFWKYFELFLIFVAACRKLRNRTPQTRAHQN